MPPVVKFGNLDDAAVVKLLQQRVMQGPDQIGSGLHGQHRPQGRYSSSELSRGISLAAW